MLVLANGDARATRGHSLGFRAPGGGDCSSHGRRVAEACRGRVVKIHPVRSVHGARPVSDASVSECGLCAVGLPAARLMGGPRRWWPPVLPGCPSRRLAGDSDTSHSIPNPPRHPSEGGRSKSPAFLSTLVGVLIAPVFVVVTVGLFVPVFGTGPVVTPRVSDAGAVTRGTVLRVRSRATNPHPWSIVVTGLKGDCGCARGFIDRKVPFTLHPLQSVELEIAVDTADQPQSLSHSISIITQDAADITPVKIRAMVSLPQSQGR